MKTLIARSAALAACATLLLAGTAVQASANDGDHSTPSSVTNNADDKIIVIGNNNNAAGNDLIVGDNNVSGTGHTVGSSVVDDSVGDYIGFAIANHSSETLTIESASDCVNCYINSPGTLYPFTMPPNENSVVFPQANLSYGDQAQLNLTYMVGTTTRTLQVLMTRGPLGALNIYCPTNTPEIACRQVDNRTLELVDA
ncbi:hypothetical protein AB0D37_41040 [Streptomyces sp. NPDC048384]|uniref:hypothetical protein n=1 Tax=Streptomyces sp. NPDC048384 TaxID=3155487 RepID=UPI00341BA500